MLLGFAGNISQGGGSGHQARGPLIARSSDTTKGESDCLIKTKHCDGLRRCWRNEISAQCSECQSARVRVCVCTLQKKRELVLERERERVRL